MEIKEALKFTEKQLTIVANGGVSRPDAIQTVDAYLAVRRAIPISAPLENTFRGACADDKKAREEIYAYDETHRPGYYGLVKLPTGVEGIYIRSDAGSNFIGVNSAKMDKYEISQLGLALHVLDQVFKRVDLNEAFSINDLVPTLEARQIENHLSWLEQRNF